MAVPKTLKVWVVDDSFLIREGLRQLLGLSSELEIAGLFDQPAAVLQALQSDVPDVLVTDIRMPPSFSDEGLQLAQALRVRYPRLGVVLLSQTSNAEHAARLLENGASGRGYLLKDHIHDLDHLVSTLQAVARGECRIDPRLIDGLMATRERREALDLLTPRQQVILGEIAQGKSNAAIAEGQGVTLRAVEKHISELFSRLGLANDEAISRRVRATLMYLERNSP